MVFSSPGNILQDVDGQEPIGSWMAHKWYSGQEKELYSRELISFYGCEASFTYATCSFAKFTKLSQ